MSDLNLSAISAILNSPSISPFEAAILEAQLDNYDLRKNLLIRNSQIIAADDYLEVIARTKNKSGRLKTFMNPNYIDVMKAHPTYSFTAANCPGNQSDYPIHAIKPSEDCVIICKNGYAKLKILRLSELTESRYRMILDAIVGSDVFLHNIRYGVADRNKLESMRQVVIRHFTVHRYELMFTFNSELSELLEPVFARNAVKSVGQTHYLRNNPKKQKVLYTSKAYNVTALLDGKRDSYSSGDCVKIELTYWPKYFDTRDITIRMLTTPEKIFSLFAADNAKLFSKYVLGNLYRTERRNFDRLTGTYSDAEIMKKISDVKALKVSINQERLELENQARQISYSISKVIEHDKRLAAVENDNAELKADNSELRNQIAALTAMVHAMQNHPAVTGELDDIRKVRRLKSV